MCAIYSEYFRYAMMKGKVKSKQTKNMQKNQKKSDLLHFPHKQG